MRVPIRPATDDMLTMAPPAPCLSICWISYFMQRKTPVRLMAMTSSQISSEYSAVGTKALPPSMPALLKAQSRRP